MGKTQKRKRWHVEKQLFEKNTPRTLKIWRKRHHRPHFQATTPQWVAGCPPGCVQGPPGRGPAGGRGPPGRGAAGGEALLCNSTGRASFSMCFFRQARPFNLKGFLYAQCDASSYPLLVPFLVNFSCFKPHLKTKQRNKFEQNEGFKA